MTEAQTAGDGSAPSSGLTDDEPEEDSTLLVVLGVLILLVVMCCVVPLTVFALFPATRPSWLGGEKKEVMISKPMGSGGAGAEAQTSTSSAQQPVTMYDVEVTHEP